MHKKVLKSVLENISFLYSVLSCLKIFLILRKKKIDVFISPEGGFGPTILKPIMLNCFYKDQSDFVLIFGYHPNRHNKLISKIFEASCFGIFREIKKNTKGTKKANPIMRPHNL